MDEHRFDAIARSLGTVRSRRGALGLLAGAAGLGLAGADARRRKGKGRKARPAAQGAACAAAGSKACTPAQAGRGAALANCDYAGADLHGTALNAANLSKASLADADLHGANLAGANLSRACLSGADLSGASLRGANLGGADLTGADLCGADLRGSNAKPAQLATAHLCCSTILPNNKPATECPAGTRCTDGACVVGQGTCPTGANSCSAVQACNHSSNCSCYVSTEGETRCADGFSLPGPGRICGACATSADCAALYPGIPGVFCVHTAGTYCCGSAPGYCSAPCPTT